MAIVKVSYTRSRGAIKANLRYNMHRPNKANERMSRVLFGHDGELSKDEAYQLIDAQKGMTYFRVILNFDPKREDTKRDLDLQSITRRAILTLEDRLQRTVNFIGVEHNADHTELRHVHAIALVKLKYKEKLTVSDWRAVRQAATESALFQRRAGDLVQNYQLDRSFTQRYAKIAGGKARRTREPYRRMRLPPRSCPSCGRRLSMKRVRDGQYKCFECGLKQEQSAGLSL